MSIDQIQKKSGTRWRARVSLANGKRASRCFHRKVDAERWEAKLRIEGSGSAELRRRQVRFSDLGTMFLNQARAELSIATYQKYDAALRFYLLPKFGGYWVEDIQKLLITEFKGELMNQPCSASTKNFVFSTFKTMLKKAVEWDLLKENPSISVRPPKKGLPRTDYWKELEIRSFLIAMKDHARFPLYMIALNTGMRAGEILGLRWDCVDLDNEIIEVRRSLDQKTGLVKETTKTHTGRRIGINRDLLPLLRDLNNKANSEFVFNLNSIGCKRATHLARVFASDCRRAGVRPIRFHDLRHTYATQFVKNKGSIYALANLLGHSTTAMTSRYAHFGPEHAKEASSVVSFGITQLAPVVPLRASAANA